MNFTILKLDSIDSTNSEAIKQAKQGADEGLCVVARQQTAGRGRFGRTWVSDLDAGLYFSIVLRPNLEMQFLPLLTLMAGVAVHDTLAEFSLNPDIKWVNDILIGGKKICGILAETTETPTGIAVIVGIGINLTSANFPDEIAYIATSIKTELGQKISADDLSEKLTHFVAFFYNQLCGDNGSQMIVDEWKRRSSFSFGKNVKVLLENGVIYGITDGLEINGALRVRTNDGELAIIQAGDVEQIRDFE